MGLLAKQNKKALEKLGKKETGLKPSKKPKNPTKRKR